MKKFYVVYFGQLLIASSDYTFLFSTFCLVKLPPTVGGLTQERILALNRNRSRHVKYSTKCSIEAVCPLLRSNRLLPAVFFVRAQLFVLFLFVPKMFHRVIPQSAFLDIHLLPLSKFQHFEYLNYWLARPK